MFLLEQEQKYVKLIEHQKVIKHDDVFSLHSVFLCFIGWQTRYPVRRAVEKVGITSLAMDVDLSLQHGANRLVEGQLVGCKIFTYSNTYRIRCMIFKGPVCRI